MTTVTTNTVDVPDFIEMTPAKCAWCRASIGLSYNGIAHEDNEDLVAWCSGSKECRERQLRWAIKEDLPSGVVHWLFLPTPKQVICMEAPERNLFVWGNRGGGKSFCFRWFCHAMSLAKPGFKYAILRTKFPELEINHLNFLNDEMAKFGPENKSQYHKTSHTCFYPNGSIGYYRQCENDDDVKKILGAEVDLLVFDEAPTFRWDHMRLIGGSVRKKRGRKHSVKVRYLGNPTGESIDELWSYFIDKDVITDDTGDDDDLCDPEYDPADWANIEMRLEDNPYLDYAEYRKQFAGIAKHIRKAWQDGVRAEERALFEFYPRIWDDEKGEMIPYHVVDELPRLADDTPIIEYDAETGSYKKPAWVQVYRAYDHGFSPDPAVVLWFAIVGRLIICFKEQFWKRTIAEDIAKECVEESKGLDVVDTYCDPTIDIKTGNSVYTTLQVFENNKMPMNPMKNDRALFCDVIHRILGEEIGPNQPRIVFYSRGCPQLIKHLPRQKWDEHDTTKMAEHKHDHAPVALAYFAESHVPITKPGEARKIRKWMVKKKKKGMVH